MRQGQLFPDITQPWYGYIPAFSSEDYLKYFETIMMNSLNTRADPNQLELPFMEELRVRLRKLELEEIFRHLYNQEALLKDKKL